MYGNLDRVLSAMLFLRKPLSNSVMSLSLQQGEAFNPMDKARTWMEMFGDEKPYEKLP